MWMFTSIVWLLEDGVILSTFDSKNYKFEDGLMQQLFFC
jgi:hypothetical protein